MAWKVGVVGFWIAYFGLLQVRVLVFPGAGIPYSTAIRALVMSF